MNHVYTFYTCAHVLYTYTFMYLHFYTRTHLCTYIFYTRTFILYTCINVYTYSYTCILIFYTSVH
ncbi:hypothetical protein LINPERPRIM_LOCUS24174, partial [Linum perenne]